MLEKAFWGDANQRRISFVKERLVDITWGRCAASQSQRAQPPSERVSESVGWPASQPNSSPGQLQPRAAPPLTIPTARSEKPLTALFRKPDVDKYLDENGRKRAVPEPTSQRPAPINRNNQGARECLLTAAFCVH